MKNKLENLWFRPYTPILFLITLVLLIYFVLYPTFQKLLKSPPSPTPLYPANGGATPPTSLTILTELAKLMVLPTDETPQIITVTDATRFTDQPFLKKARNGDVLVIYQKAKKAILFDPKEFKIIDTAPIAESTQSATPSAIPQNL